MGPNCIRVINMENEPSLPSAPALRPHEVEGLLARDGVLTADAALGLCASFGIIVAEWAVVESVEGALVAAGAIGYPVALKVLSAQIPDKSEVGGIALGVGSPRELRTNFAALLARMAERVPDARMEGVLVQRMLSGGREVVLGGRRDPSLGPVVLFDSGGVYVEVSDDIAPRPVPLTRGDAEAMISEAGGSCLLYGVRDEPSAGVEALVEALLSLSRLLFECPEILEIDVHPLLVFERGVAAIDARVVVDSQKT